MKTNWVVGSFLIGVVTSLLVVRLLRKQERSPLAASTDEIMEQYKGFLRGFSPFHLRKFTDRLVSDPESAKSEAVSWYVLETIDAEMDIIPGETKKGGGPDFCCQPKTLGTPSPGTDFVVEVTSLSPEAVSNRSGWPNSVEEGARAFQLITENLKQKMGDKQQQHQELSTPLVLMITSSHLASNVLMNALPAKMFLYSATHLFEEWDSISAVILVSIYSDSCHTLGILNPAASAKLDIGLFPSIPFLRALDWPPKDPNSVRSDWTVEHPEPTRYWFVKSFPKTDT